MPHQTTTATLHCVDDGKSAHDNRIIDERDVTRGADGGLPWTSSERMLRKDALYTLGVVVDHNPARTPGFGSCIFLHVWRAPDKATVGCTTRPHEQLRDIVAWLSGAQHPLLVQLPRAVYDERRTPWGLLWLPPVAAR